jgi:Flp pilus assembly secretin CpaC
MNTAAVRELGVQLGLNMSTSSFGFGIGGSTLSGAQSNLPLLLTTNPGSSTVVNAGNDLIASVSPVAPPGFPALGSSPRIFPGYSPTSVNFQGANSITALVPGTGGVNPQTFTTAVSGIGQGINPTAPGLINSAFLFGAPGGAVFNALGLGNIFTAVSNFPRNQRYRWSINPTVDGIITHSRSRVLAEPTLVTISGERASFLAGGEIPIVQSLATAGTAQQSVVFEPFGLRLNMIPVLQENGTINLEVAPEERIRSDAGGLNLVGVGFIPGFITRKMQTIVELKPGQELFISGLVTANSGRELNKTPLLGEVPVLGALYRSKAFSKNESELVVAVRPEIILPGTPGQLRLPEEISRVEGPRDTNLLQVEPTVVDERYNTSGRNERNQRIPGVLPAGSPIPDSQ